MDVNERDRLAAAIASLRPDLAPGAGVDRLKSLKTWLTRNAMEWAYRDAVVRMCLCVIDPATVTPARALTDGPWLALLRQLDGASATAKMPGYTALEPECGSPGCGVRRDKHLAHVIPAEIPPHEWEQSRPVTRASTEQIRAAHEAAFTPPKESEHVE